MPKLLPLLAYRRSAVKRSVDLLLAKQTARTDERARFGERARCRGQESHVHSRSRCSVR